MCSALDSGGAEVREHCLALYNRYPPTPERDGQQAIGFGWLLATVAELNRGASG